MITLLGRQAQCIDSSAGCLPCSVRADAAEALRATARRLSAAETEVAQLKSDVAALMQELNNRPTVQENRCGCKQ